LPPSPKDGDNSQNEDNPPDFEERRGAVFPHDEERDDDRRPEKSEPDNGEDIYLLDQHLENDGRTPQNMMDVKASPAPYRLFPLT